MKLDNEILHISLENLEGTAPRFRVIQVGTYVNMYHLPYDYYDFYSACAEATKQAERLNVPIKVNCTLYSGGKYG